MTAFNSLPEAGASQDADQVAVARGGSTLRQTIGRVLAGVPGLVDARVQALGLATNAAVATAQAAAIATVRGGVGGARDTLAKLSALLDEKAPLAAPALTGAPTAPTAPANTNSRQLATTEYVDRAIAALPGGGGGGHPTLRFGTSADGVPTAAEATIVGANGMGTIDAYAGDRHHLIYRLASEGDISSVLYSDDQSQTNQVGAFTEYAQIVRVGGDDYAVWVSNQALSQTLDVTLTVA